MPINPEKVGAQISTLRKTKNMTQNDLGERLSISYQAVSKWERGETLPDTALLLPLAQALGTTADDILRAGAPVCCAKHKTMAELREGIDCLERVGALLGQQNVIFRHAIDGISQGLNTDIDAMLADPNLRECLIAEAAIQCLRMGYTFDPAEMRSGFHHPRWSKIVLEYMV